MSTLRALRVLAALGGGRAAARAALVAAVAGAAAFVTGSVAVRANDAVAPTPFAWGANYHGQLGLGHENSQWLPQQIAALGTSRVRKLVAGGNMTAALLESGELLTFGMGRDLALGHDDDNNESLPRTVTTLSVRARDVSVGKRHMAVVDVDGNVLTWGKGLGGRLGHGSTADQSLPKRVANLPASQSVACGNFVTAALTGDGRVFYWGSRIMGRPGHESRPAHMSPLQATLPVARAVRCGDSHIVACTHDGQVFAWGFDDYGQLGVGQRSEETQETPQLVRALHHERVLDVAAGAFHTVALTESGQVYTWGLGRDGALGHGDVSDSRIPKKVQALVGHKVVAVAAGEGHTACLMEDGTLFLFGKGRDGQLGLEEVAYRPEPRRVTALASKRVTSVSCGENHTVALTVPRS